MSRFAGDAQVLCHIKIEKALGLRAGRKPGACANTIVEGPMQTIDLTAEETDVLRDVISHVIGDMSVEVFRTDTHDFKKMLKHRRAVLEKILLRLELCGVSSTSA